jgi:hypothetical protein
MPSKITARHEDCTGDKEMLAPIIHILPLTNIRRSRLLPFPGHVAVHPGQKVNASDVIAQARVASGHLVLDIRRSLKIPTISAAERCIVRQQGDRLEKGDVVAESGGMFSQIVRAPADGDVVLISAGMVVIRVRSAQTELRAGFTGTVVDIIPDRGAVIEANGALIQGLWGNGRIDSGLLLLIAHAPDEELTRQAIDVSMRGAVVLAGHCSSAEALQAGLDLPLRGLILSSMASELLPVAAGLNYPIIVIEGFGKLPMNEAAFKLLSTSEKRDISVNATLNPSAGERPELVIQLPAVGQTAPETDTFAPNKMVRIQGLPYTGKVGTILQVRKGFYAMPSGLKVNAADVQIDKDTRVTVPLANLELIE